MGNHHRTPLKLVQTRNGSTPVTITPSRGLKLGFLPRQTPRSESQFTALPHKKRVTPRETGFKQGGWEAKFSWLPIWVKA